MNEPVPIGALAGCLCGHLAAAIANFLVGISGSESIARKGDTFWHMAMTDFEFAYAALETFGVFPPQLRPDGETENAFIVDAKQMPLFLASHDVSDRVIETVEASVRIACGYGSLPDRVDWFDRPEQWRTAMKYIALAGYAEQAGLRYRWTIMVEPIMVAAGFWDEGQSLNASTKNGLEANIDLAWETMPDTLRQSIRSSSIGLIELVKVVALSCKDRHWDEFNRDQPVALCASHMSLARELLNRGS